MIWFTADHHFGHANIIKYTKRPFESVEEMDGEMIRRWNEVVRAGDVVYHLGDFTLGPNIVRYAAHLNGNIRVIPGGHDKRWLKRYDGSLPSLEVLDRLVIIKESGYTVTLCHYPLLSWEQSHYGMPHLHGHCHGTIGEVGQSGDKQLPPGQKVGRRVDVGVDCWDFYPVSWDTLRGLIS